MFGIKKDKNKKKKKASYDPTLTPTLDSHITAKAAQIMSGMFEDDSEELYSDVEKDLPSTLVSQKQLNTPPHKNTTEAAQPPAVAQRQNSVIVATTPTLSTVPARPSTPKKVTSVEQHPIALPSPPSNSEKSKEIGHKKRNSTGNSKSVKKSPSFKNSKQKAAPKKHKKTVSFSEDTKDPINNRALEAESKLEELKKQLQDLNDQQEKENLARHDLIEQKAKVFDLEQKLQALQSKVQLAEGSEKNLIQKVEEEKGKRQNMELKLQQLEEEKIKRQKMELKLQLLEEEKKENVQKKKELEQRLQEEEEKQRQVRELEVQALQQQFKSEFEQKEKELLSKEEELEQRKIDEEKTNVKRANSKTKRTGITTKTAQR